jgi:hypothetical protein
VSFGNDTVYFVTVTEDTNNRDRYGKPEKIRTETAVTGCHFRPLTAKEKIELGDIVTDPYKCTAPPVSTAMNANAKDELKFDGVTYQVVGGARPFRDLSGPFKVTLICERITS